MGILHTQTDEGEVYEKRNFDEHKKNSFFNRVRKFGI